VFVGLSGIAGGRLFVFIDGRILWDHEIVVVIAFHRIRAVILVCVTLSIWVTLSRTAWLGRSWISAFRPVVFFHHGISPT
jgi:hypothetical protein